MIVDDEEFCIATMRAMFENYGFSSEFGIDFCINGKEAVEKVVEAYEHGMSYGMIFTDFSMPILNGIDATVEIRDYLLKVQKLQIGLQPIIIGITGHVQESF